jgi:hypothetical protein
MQFFINEFGFCTPIPKLTKTCGKKKYTENPKAIIKTATIIKIVTCPLFSIDNSGNFYLKILCSNLLEFQNRDLTVAGAVKNPQEVLRHGMGCVSKKLLFKIWFAFCSLFSEKINKKLVFDKGHVP